MDNPACIVCASSAKVVGNKSGYTLWKCNTCALVFIHPIHNVAHVYGEDYFAGASSGFGYVDYDADKEAMVSTFETYLSRITPLVVGTKKLLDVGAATGFFLDIAKRFGFDVYGVEISPFAAARGTEKGLRMIAGTLCDVPPVPLFNVITMLDVIEHVADPRGECVRAHALLEQGGLLVINTPDIGSLYAKIMGSRWHLIVPPEHIFFFNRQNMRTLLKQTGFEVLLVSTIGKRFTLQYIFKTLYTWQGLSIWKHLSEVCGRAWLNRIAIPINLRDNMFIIARKK